MFNSGSIEKKRPLEYVEMSINCMLIPERGKKAPLLTLLDVHTRKAPAYFSTEFKQRFKYFTFAQGTELMNQYFNSQRSHGSLKRKLLRNFGYRKATLWAKKLMPLKE